MHKQRSAGFSQSGELRLRQLAAVTGSSLNWNGATILVKQGEDPGATGAYDVVVVDRILQRETDYRAAVRSWFAATKVGGHLVIAVPHAFLYDRRSVLPAQWDRRQRRLYTAATITSEIEEALEPNSYRIRLVRDDDTHYDYAAPAEEEPVGACDVVVVLEKIPQPDWTLTPGSAASSDDDAHLFFAPTTRVERAATPANGLRILLLKLDHLGDFVMAVPALQQIRTAFPDAFLELVVGPWNADLARGFGIVDEVSVFSAFPRNASEEDVDVRGRRALFEQTVTEHYDLAIDLRTDPDTRFLLASVKADLRAGLGNLQNHPFLDIFLPIDESRDGRETSSEERWDQGLFASAPPCVANPFRILFGGSGRPKRGALVWGPYRRLRHGSYIFKPLVETGRTRLPASLMLEIVIDDRPVCQQTITNDTITEFAFDVGPGGGVVQFRIWAPRWKPALPFSFYGGRLFRRGTGNVLHQSEYLALLARLVDMRMNETGMLQPEA